MVLLSPLHANFLKPVDTIALGSYDLYGIINSQGEFLLQKYDRFDDACNYYYSNLQMQGAKISLSEAVNEALSELGFEPINRMDDRKPSFQIYPASDIDDSGHVFLSFQYNQKDISGDYARQIGVWHKDKGFQHLKIPKLEYVSHIVLNKNHLLVFGHDKSGARRLAIFEKESPLFE